MQNTNEIISQIQEWITYYLVEQKMKNTLNRFYRSKLEFESKSTRQKNNRNFDILSIKFKGALLDLTLFVIILEKFDLRSWQDYTAKEVVNVDGCLMYFICI